MREDLHTNWAWCGGKLQQVVRLRGDVTQERGRSCPPPQPCAGDPLRNVSQLSGGFIWMRDSLAHCHPGQIKACALAGCMDRGGMWKVSPPPGQVLFPGTAQPSPRFSCRDLPHSHVSCLRLPWITTINNKDANFWSATLWTSSKSIFDCNLFHQKPVLSLHLHLLLSTNPHITPSQAFPLHKKVFKSKHFPIKKKQSVFKSKHFLHSCENKQTNK